MASVARGFLAALILAALILIAAGTGAGWAENPGDPQPPSAAYRDKVATLVERSGMDLMVEQLVDGMLVQLEPLLKGAVRQDVEAAGESVTDAQLNEVMRAFRADMNDRMSGFFALLAPVYAEHFTMEELDYLLWIYDRPTVRKSVRVQPQMAQRLGAVAEGWFSENAEQALTVAIEETLGAP